MSDDLITVAEAARLLGVHHQTVRNLIAAGKLETVIDGRFIRRGRVKVRRSDIERLRR